MNSWLVNFILALGPGTYNIPAFFADVPKFMMTNHPGPGEYYTKKGDQGPKWGFGTG